MIHENDVTALVQFRQILDQTFGNNLAQKAKVTASHTRGNDQTYSAKHVLDHDKTTYWATDDTVTTPEFVLDFGNPTTFNVICLREYLPLGERIEAFALDAWQDGGWKEFATGTSIGNKRLIRLDKQNPLTATKLRVRIIKAPVCPAISEIGVYIEP